MTTRKWVGSRRCWHCGKQLMTKKGGGYHFAEMQDPIGNVMRVHLDCASKAIGDGVTKVAK